ncbi:transglutaminase domain-containing protein [Chitinophaga parva]|nr:transglutaminase domain-containing protein [Chitinophaga parva]
MLRFVLAALVLLTTPTRLQAQEKSPCQFGQVSVDDFRPTSYAVDTGAAAVYLADVGKASYNDRSGDLELEFTRYTRIHILHKNGYDEATFTIPLYSGNAGKPDVLNDLKAVTYNLENGRVVATKLDIKTIFTEKEDREWVVKKFSMPAVKEGSIVEVSYTRSGYVDRTPPSWDFQGSCPRIWSGYTVSIPQWYGFVFLRQGYYDVDYDSKERVANFAFNYTPTGAHEAHRGIASVSVTDHFFSARNLPGLRDESFTTTLRNHLCRVEFQLASVHYPNSDEHRILSTWPQMQEELFRDATFGAPLMEDNVFLEDVIKQLTAKAPNDTEKAKAIYRWVQQHMTCTGYSGMYMEAPGLRHVFTSGRGTGADINLLLVAMLRKAGLEAWPLILSTRAHGKTYEEYPLHRRFDYVTAWVQADGREYNLDGSRGHLGFGHLPLYLYNGHARLMSPEAPARYFNADTLHENLVTAVRMNVAANGNVKGTYTEQEGYYRSLHLRDDVASQGQDAFRQRLARILGNDATVSNLQLINLDSIDAPVAENFDFEWEHNGDGSRLYLHPIVGQVQVRNPFTAMERRYPVEMSYMDNETYIASILIPPGYVVEGVPAPANITLPDGAATFRYQLRQDGNLVQVRVMLNFNRAVFSPEEYEGLRRFFDLIVNKEAELLVLRKQS